MTYLFVSGQTNGRSLDTQSWDELSHFLSSSQCVQDKSLTNERRDVAEESKLVVRQFDKTFWRLCCLHQIADAGLHAKFAMELAEGEGTRLTVCGPAIFRQPVAVFLASVACWLWSLWGYSESDWEKVAGFLLSCDRCHLAIFASSYFLLVLRGQQ